MCDQTHDVWMEGLFEEAAKKMWEQRVEQMLHEFRVLGQARIDAANFEFNDVGDM